MGQNVEPIFFSYRDYLIPLDCWHYPTVDRYDSFCCNNNNYDDSVCYTLIESNTFFANHMTELCLQLENLWQDCKMTDTECAQSELYNYFFYRDYKRVYG